MVRERRGKLVRRWLSALLCLLIGAGLLAGCGGRGGSAPAGMKEIQAGYTRGQVMVVVATERNRYQNVYTDQIWEAVSHEDGLCFEDKLMRQIRQFFTELAVMESMAGERQIELTSQEKDALSRLAQEYYGQLEEGDLDYMGVSQEEVYQLYCSYYTANKLAAQMLGEDELEISDAQAKVIHVQQIVTDSLETAQEALEAVSGGKEDFAAAAGNYSVEEEIDRTLERTEEPGPVEEAAFGLEQDEISQIVEQDGRYYILKCTNAYDEEATQRRKYKLGREKLRQAFREAYEPYAQSHEVVFENGLWEDIPFKEGESCHTTDFFELYQKYFQE